MYEELDKVVLADGRTAHVLEVFNGGEGYLVDIPTPDGESAFAQEFVESSSIVGIADK